MPRLPKQRLITGAAPAVSVAGGLALAISLCFRNHAPQQLPNCLTLEQQAPISSGATFLGGAVSISVKTNC